MIMLSSVSAQDKFMLSAITVLTEDLSAQTIYRRSNNPNRRLNTGLDALLNQTR